MDRALPHLDELQTLPPGPAVESSGLEDSVPPATATSSSARAAGVVLAASFLILAGFVAWNRVFQVDEAQNVYGLWLLAGHKFSAYDFYAPPYLLLLRPLLWFVNTAPAIFLAVRMAWLAVFAALGWLLLRASGIRQSDPLFTPAVAALGLTAPLWTYGLEIRHEGPGVLALLGCWTLLAPFDGRPRRCAYLLVGALSGFVLLNAVKHVLFLAPLLVLALVLPHPAYSSRSRIRLLVTLAGGFAAGVAVLLALYAWYGAAGIALRSHFAFLHNVAEVARTAPRALAGVLLHQTPLLIGFLLWRAGDFVVSWRRTLLSEVWRNGAAQWIWMGSVALGTLANPVAFPYNSLALVAAGWVVTLRPSLDFFLGETRSRRRRSVGWSLLVLGLGLPWALQVLTLLGWTNHRQLQLMETAAALTAPGTDRVFDAAGLVPGREAIAPTWFIHLMNAPSLRQEGPGSLHERFVEHPPAVVIPSYRMNYLSRPTLEFIREHYLPIAPDLWVPGAQLDDSRASWTCILAGRYWVSGAESGGLRCDGAAVAPGASEFSRGDHTCTVPTGTRVTLTWIGPGLVRPPELGRALDPLFPSPSEW